MSARGTIPLSAPVLGVLAQATVKAHGPAASALCLPPGQLDRKLYLEVAKAAEALGCVWNRAAKALLADASADQLEAALVQALDMGEVVDQDKAMQFFETPEKLALRLISAAGVEPGMRVLEPSCGRCAIARQLPLGVDHLGLVELDTRHRAVIEGFQSEWDGDCDAVIGADFLQLRAAGPGHPAWRAFDAVVMNPPFAGGQAVAHITHALDFLRPGGKLAAVAPASVGFRQDAKHRRFRELVGANTGSIEPLPNGSFMPATPVRTVLVTMTRAE